MLGRASTLALALAAVPLAGCLDPTQILLEVTTDVPCDQVENTQITVGKLSEVTEKPPAITTTRCLAESQRIGSTMILPKAADDALVAVNVVLAFDAQSLDGCFDSEKLVDDRCIVARRAVNFLPHTKLRLPVEMQLACAGVDCEEDQTCFDGVCLPATIPDPADCAGGNECFPVKPPDAGVAEDAGPDAMMDMGGVDVIAMDMGGSDLGSPDVADAFVDESGAPDALADVSMDLGMDVSPDVSTDAPPDVSMDMGVDAPPDLGPDVPAGDAGAVVPTHVFSEAFGDPVGADRANAVAIAAGTGLYSAVGAYFGTPSFGGPALPAGTSGNLFVATFAPSGTHMWSNGYGAGQAEEAFGVATDSAGNVYVGGSYGVGCSVGGAVLTSFGVAGTTDAFVVKYASGGAHLWSAGWGGTSNDKAFAVAVEGSGNTYVVGTFNGAIDFNPAMASSGEHTAPAGQPDAFVVALDTNGTFRWSRALGSTLSDQATAIALDATGNIYVAGAFRGTVDFGGGSLTAPGAVSDVFVSSYTSAGMHRWSRQYGGTADEVPRGIGVSPVRLVVAGEFNGATTFGPSYGLQDAFVAGLAFADGTLQWSATHGNGAVTLDRALAVAIDPSGTSVVAGSAQGGIDLGGGSRGGGGATDAWFASYTVAGAHRWSVAYGTAGNNQSSGVAGGVGALVGVGFIGGPVDFGSGTPVGIANQNAFVVELNP